jgi:spermidine/putrescine transport system substrate-binding protein
MKKLFPLLTAALVLAGTACSRQSKPVLRIYNWAEYISPDVIAAFEEKHNCKVNVDVFDSNEAMYAKLKAGGAGYDIVVPSSYQVVKLRDEGMLLPIDAAKIPNLSHLDPAAKRFTQDPENKHSVPYLVTTAGIGLRRDRAPDASATWAVFADPQYKGRMTLLDDMRETLGASLKANGHSLNSTNPDEIAAARDLVIAWKKNAAKFESEQYKNGLISAEFVIAHGYSSDILQAVSENENIEYLKPVEGVSLALDELVILSGAPNPDLAHAFINYLHEPAVAAENMEWVQAMTPNKSAYALVSEDYRNDTRIFLSDADLAKAETIFDLGAGEKLYIDAWNAVKTAAP